MPQAYNLNLFQRVTRNTTGLAYTGDLTYHAKDWKRKSRAVGGYWSGSFVLSSDTLSKAELDAVYNSMLGTRLVETCYGMTSWEGLIWQMDYHQRGSTFRRTLDKSVFHNSVSVWYSSDIGDRAKTVTTTNADSILEYGTCELIASIGGANAVAATAMRDSLLIANAWPRSREVGTLTIGEGDRPRDDYIAVTVAGYWHTLNWVYRSYSIDDTPNAIFTNLISTAEFVSEGRVETNADVVRLEASQIPLQKGDAVARIINFGDSAGDIWQGGVYAGRLFNYEEAPTDWDYQYRDGRLLDKAGQDVPFPLLEPGFLMFNASAPTGGQPPGTSTAWDDPRIRYVEEVEFVAPDEMRLSFSAESRPLILTRRIQGGGL